MSVHLFRELERLKTRILALGEAVDRQLQNAITSISVRDGALAAELAAHDDTIDDAEVDIEEECLKVLALYQPVAGDLRFIITVLKIGNDLERIGDIAVHLAIRCATVIARTPSLVIPEDFVVTAARTSALLQQYLHALTTLDAGAARGICATDGEIDRQCRRMFDTLKASITAQPATANDMLDLLIIPRHLERIADHIVNMAEDLLYMIEGRIVRHMR
jgi:phosphate transport system protein